MRTLWREESIALIHQVAEPRPAGDSVKAAVGRAARRLGMGITRARSIWYGEARRIESSEMDTMRRVARDRAAHEQHAMATVCHARELLVAMREALAAVDTHANRAVIAAIDDAIARLGT